jgi:hypothetical protein
MKVVCIHIEGLPKGELVLGQKYEIKKAWTDYGVCGGIEKVQLVGQHPNTWYLKSRFKFSEEKP